MPLAEATALVDCAHADPPHLELYDPVADRLALAALAEWCQRFSPSVGVEESERPESLLLDVTGLGRLCGGEPALVEQVVRAFHEERRLTVRAALADTYAAAWAVAHFADLEVPDPPGGTTDLLAALRVPRIVPPGETWPALASLNVAALRLPDDVCALLSDLGLRRIEQVAALDRSTLLARFGPLVLARLDQARGTAAEAIVAQALPPVCEFQRLFEHPTGRLETIHAALVELIAQACVALERQRRGVLRLGCRLESEQRRAHEFVVGLYRPSADVRHLGELALLKLEAMRFGEPIAVLRLTVLAADRLEYHQQAIFVDESALRESPRELAALVDRLSNRLGAQAVLRPWLLAGAQPEFTCQYQPLASLSTQRKKRRRLNTRAPDGVRASEAPASPPGDRPLCLLKRPLRLAVMSVAPEGPPMRFSLGGCDHRVAHVWGPERIETGWWRGRCVRRDYYQVETGEGNRFWLFRELGSGAWFLHGEFA